MQGEYDAMQKNQSLSTHIIILAAGKGKRMHSRLPKVLHPIAHKPLISWVLDTAQELEPQGITVVIGEQAEGVQSLIARYPGTQTVLQSPARGTGDAVRVALPTLPDSLLVNPNAVVVVMYGDTPFIQTDTLKTLVGIMANNTQCAIALLTFEAENPKGYGRIMLDANGGVSAIIEEAVATSAEKDITLCNAGFMAIRAHLLADALAQLKENPQAHEYYLVDLVAILHTQGHTVQHHVCDESELLGVNSQMELAWAEWAAQRMLREKIMTSGVMMTAPDTVMLAHDTIIGSGSIVGPYTVFGPGVTIGEETQIREFSSLEGAHIGNHAIIGPFARIRPGTELADEVRIGNFVEVKKSHMGKGSKANHLAYIGDTIMGAECNIGAGTITCNYDGQKKHTTTLGDGVFVGSNTALVAPITLGNGVKVGAGSTLTKNVPKEHLAVSRTEQRHLELKKSHTQAT
jgi:bifunctional UDP-N-acetylglucosamine pyrophosphorylase/glucosamine-1-phosphate N-acetyltransferase